MPVFEYTGVTAAGKKVKGVLDVENARALRDSLRAKGIFVTEFGEGGEEGAKRPGEVEIKLPWAKGFSMRDVAVMTRQLATLVRAGIPLVESLRALAEQTEKPALKRIISEVRQSVSEGDALAKAMGAHPEAFGELYVNMIRAGESSGNLDVVLDRLTEFLDAQMGLRSKVIGAMVYPLLMVVMGTGIVAFLMLFVIPKITQIFEDQQAALPFITVVLITASHLLGKFWYLVIAAIAGGVSWFRKWHASKEGRRKWDVFVLRVPVFGPLARMVAVSRFAKTLGTLLSSGVPLLTAMGIVKNILGNTRLIDVVEDARANIREGESIATPLQRSGEFPPMMTHMIAVGERTGALEEMLDNVAIAYDAEVNGRIQAMTTLLEPLMLVGMGVVVAFIVFAVLLPILQLNQTVGA
ncbi:MAG: type II secretion system inner membrane protein GspF [Myxococcales bacterium]|nr:type II secretion system inner membrane protein GspF [Myxococcales bacterium]MCB9520045.1 type II secretion system inner membrane protein GspF [Myxococcales bacterium]